SPAGSIRASPKPTPTTSSTRSRPHATTIPARRSIVRSEEHTSELQSPCNLVCRLLLEKKKKKKSMIKRTRKEKNNQVITVLLTFSYYHFQPLRMAEFLGEHLYSQTALALSIVTHLLMT